MLQISFLRQHTEKAIAGLNKRHFPNAAQVISEVLAIDDERRHTQAELDKANARLNALSKEIGILIKAGKHQEAETAKAETLELKTTSKHLSDKLAALEEELTRKLYTIPNIPHESVPDGRSAQDNEVVFQHGSLPTLDSNALPHWDLVKKYDIIDFELGNKITGAGFPVYKNKGAKLQRALMNFFLDRATQAGYVEIQPPSLVNEASGYGTGQLPDKDGQMYYIAADGLYLIPTAEVPITNLYRDMILRKEDLPIKNVGFTPCFRREAGSWGAHVRGLNRLHQFEKVEIVQIQTPDKSYEALQEMCQYVKSLLIDLELPFRMVKLCGGDMGFTAALTYDFEVYAAAQQRWLEVSSVSNFETFQATRLKLRYRDENNKTQLLHTLNGSALAFPRVVAALLENHQTSQGIRLPKVLVPYTGFDVID
ncbi:MAG: serine--tRNA ligase [Cytophagales bacterium]|nr:serine--tRNA ligase [Bernardetiaceae bacterium]MDW8210802.1 serine--tRNA ligase [Cytophagales bacterium]